jgi:ankyrin repeat protein
MQPILVVFSNKAETMRLLIEHGADVNAQDETHSMPLHMASSSGIPDLVQLLIEHRADTNGQDLSNRTPLHLASSCVSSKTAFHSIRLRTDVHEQEIIDNEIFQSVDADTIEDTMRLLIDHKANVAARDETHSTPLHLAALWGNTKAVRLLIEHGADVSAQDGNHRTPLHLASSRRVGVSTM